MYGVDYQSNREWLDFNFLMFHHYENFGNHYQVNYVNSELLILHYLFRIKKQVKRHVIHNDFQYCVIFFLYHFLLYISVYSM